MNQGSLVIQDSTTGVKKESMLIIFGGEYPVNQVMVKFLEIYSEQTIFSRKNLFSVLDNSLMEDSKILEFIRTTEALLGKTHDITYLALRIYETDAEKPNEDHLVQKVNEKLEAEGIIILWDQQFITNFWPK